LVQKNGTRKPARGSTNRGLETRPGLRPYMIDRHRCETVGSFTSATRLTGAKDLPFNVAATTLTHPRGITSGREFGVSRRSSVGEYTFRTEGSSKTMGIHPYGTFPKYPQGQVVGRGYPARVTAHALGPLFKPWPPRVARQAACARPWRWVQLEWTMNRCPIMGCSSRVHLYPRLPRLMATGTPQGRAGACWKALAMSCRGAADARRPVVPHTSLRPRPPAGTGSQPCAAR